MADERYTSRLTSAVRVALCSRAPRLHAGLLAVTLTGASAVAPAEPFPALFELSSIDGTNGFIMTGTGRQLSELCGHAVSAAGDVNYDGIDDLIIGALGAFVSPSARGAGYVIYGRAAFPAIFDRTWLDGVTGSVLSGSDVGIADSTGYALASAGDVNGDGIDDLIVGAPSGMISGRYGAGQSYVVFGNEAGMPALMPLGELDGANGFLIVGTEQGERAGWDVSGAGDLNGDGFDDVIVGTLKSVFTNPTGRGYVVFGHAQPFPPALMLSSLDGTNGFVFEGINERDEAGRAVSDAGDIDGDGFDDILIGAPGAGTGDRQGYGQSYVIFGRESAFPAVADLAAVNGVNGFRLNGTDDEDRSGSEVSGLGDVNGDGIDDLAIGANEADFTPQIGNVGKVFVVFGHAGPFPTGIDLSALDGSNGFVAIGDFEGYNAGWSVSEAGDVNDDGIDDFIIGAPHGSAPDGSLTVGWSYVVFGSDTGFPARLPLSSLDGSNGFAMKGIEEGSETGFSVSGAGDVNGDGVNDLVVGAPSAERAGISIPGESYVVFGRPRDTDADGVRDVLDNCTQAANSDQRDSDGDGFGNLCDADLNNDCAVNFTDLAAMKSVFFGADPDADLDGSGSVDFNDLGILKQLFFSPPGPSGTPNLCDAVESPHA